MSAITRALSTTERSYASAKQSVSEQTGALLSRGPAGGSPLIQRTDLSKAQEQERHFRGWTYASIRPIAQRIAGQPIRVGRKSRMRASKQQTRPDPLDNHELLDLLADPNDLMVSWSLRFSTVAELELTGRSLWWLPKKQQILPIPTSWIVGFEGSTSFQSFAVRPPGHAGEPLHIPADEVVYFSYPSPSDPWGATSPLQAAAGAVTADEQITNSQISMFRNGIHPSHALIVGKEAGPDGTKRAPRLTPAQERQLIGAVRKRYSGTHSHGDPLILDGLIEDVKRLSSTPNEMDFLNSGKMTRERIALSFGTNEIVMGRVEGANRASATVADKHFCDFTINPKIELLSQCLTEFLSPMFGGDLIVWIEPCVANDSEMALKWAQALAKHSALTGDELRALSPFDLPSRSEFSGPVAGGGRDLEREEAEEKRFRDLLQQMKEPVRIERPIATPSRNGNGHHARM